MLSRAGHLGRGYHILSTDLSAPYCCTLEKTVPRVATPLRLSQARPPESLMGGRGPRSLFLQEVAHSYILWFLL